MNIGHMWMDNDGCFFNITFHMHFWCSDHDKHSTTLIYYAEVRVENFIASVKTTHTKSAYFYKTPVIDYLV